MIIESIKSLPLAPRTYARCRSLLNTVLIAFLYCFLFLSCWYISDCICLRLIGGFLRKVVVLCATEYETEKNNTNIKTLGLSKRDSQLYLEVLDEFLRAYRLEMRMMKMKDCKWALFNEQIGILVQIISHAG